MANIYTGDIKKWDDLTPEQQSSGEWIKLPVDAGEVVRTRRRDVLDDIPVQKFDLHVEFARAMKKSDV